MPGTLLVVIAHHSRSAQAEALAGRVGADQVLVDPGSHGARWTHQKALRWASGRRERVWVLEDDALAPHDFRERANDAAARWSDDLISGYLGRQRPPQYQQEIRVRLRNAEARQRDWIALPTLIHGVCYSLPVGAPENVLHGLPAGAIDFAIGAAWGRPPIYTIPSLVDHADGPAIERHPDGQTRTRGRTAWRPPGGVHNDLGYTG